MALINTPTTPPNHFRPQSTRQRREVLRRIDEVEFETLQGHNNPMTGEPYLLRHTPAPLRLIKPAPQPALCGFGTCALNPECTRKCRYLEADQAIVSSTGPGIAELPVPVIDHALRRRIVIGLLVWSAACISGVLWLAIR
jgi:hypothetical protein